jgi:hypothetical protein
MSTNRSLIVVRCGDESLHKAWIGSERNWDLAVSYFGAREERDFPEANYIHRCNWGKWNGLFAFFQAYPETLERYDYFWLPDDDIEASCEQITAMFQSMKTQEFELAQPSLSNGSYLSHLLTLNNPFFLYRRVNFVELMVPVFSRAFLVKTLPLFELTRSGFGMDYVWNRFTTDPISKVAILDHVQVKHTRPVGGALHTMLKAECLSPARQEQDIFLAPYGHYGSTDAILGGLLRGGNIQVRSAFVARTIAVIGWSSRPFGNCGFTNSISAFRFLIWTTRYFFGALFAPVQLTPLEPVLPIKAGAPSTDTGS